MGEATGPSFDLRLLCLCINEHVRRLACGVATGMESVARGEMKRIGLWSSTGASLTVMFLDTWTDIAPVSARCLGLKRLLKRLLVPIGL
jgi:hypothetical protein